MDLNIALREFQSFRPGPVVFLEKTADLPRRKDAVARAAEGSLGPAWRSTVRVGGQLAARARAKYRKKNFWTSCFFRFSTGKIRKPTQTRQPTAFVGVAGHVRDRHAKKFTLCPPDGQD